MAIISGKFGGSENITGTSANDTIFPYTGFDLIDGGVGTDTVSANFLRSNVAFVKRNGLTVMELVSGASSNSTEWRLKNVERASFDDGMVALDNTDIIGGKRAIDGVPAIFSCRKPTRRAGSSALFRAGGIILDGIGKRVDITRGDQPAIDAVGNEAGGAGCVCTHHRDAARRRACAGDLHRQ